MLGMSTVEERRKQYRKGLRAGVIALVFVIFLVALPASRKSLPSYAWAFVIVSDVYCITLFIWGIKRSQRRH